MHSKIAYNFTFNSSMKRLKYHSYEIQRAYLFAQAFALYIQRDRSTADIFTCIILEQQ